MTTFETGGTPNGLGLDDAPTPEDPGLDMNGGAASDDELFGSGDDDDKHDTNRRLDDSDLDSGDDQGRTDRLANTVEDDELIEETQIAEAQTDLAPIRLPEGDELYLLNLPNFLGLAHNNYNPTTYEAPVKPHNKEANTNETAAFSAYETATSTMFWRRDPKTTDKLQSNARIVRWDDGSLTLQLATKPLDHYLITTSALRQNYSSKANKLYPHPPTEYDPNKDTNNFLAAYHASQGVDLQITRPLDASIRIQPTGSIADESVLKLQADLAGLSKTHDPLAQLKTIRVDPEYARRQAELAEKEALKAERRRKNAAEAMEFRRETTLRRGGVGRGGLSVAGLEDDDGMPTARGRKATGAKKRKTNRRGEIYSDDDEEDERGARGGRDEYDREDDFLADSDEEPELYDDGDDELPEDEDDEDAEGEVDDVPAANALLQRTDRERPREKRSATPKRPATDDDAGVQGSPQARKKRRVVESDDDE